MVCTAALPSGAVDRATQAPQERDYLLLLGRGEMQGTNLGIEARISIAAAVVILDNILETGDAAVVHVGRGAGDLAQRWRLEVALPCARVGESAVPPGDAS